MFRIVRPNLYEARIADLKEAHAREVGQLYKVIDVLMDQVEYLRAGKGFPQPIQKPRLTQVEPPPVMASGPAPYMSEEEEDLRAMHDAELIDVQELESALAQLGITADPD